MHQLPSIMQKLKVTFPNSELSVASGTSTRLVDRIMHGELDTAFISLPVDNTNVTTESLFSDEIVAIAHPKHPLAKEKYISAATLAAEKLILGERGGNTRRMIDEFFSAANVKPNVSMELSRQEAINEMVAKRTRRRNGRCKECEPRHQGRQDHLVVHRRCRDQMGARPRTVTRRTFLTDRERVREAV
jgi:DNA-binding transcriptional LysR family regulator